MEKISLVTGFVIGILFLLYLRRRDKRYLSQNVKNILSKELSEEISQDRLQYVQNKARFKRSMNESYKKMKEGKVYMSEKVKK